MKKSIIALIAALAALLAFTAVGAATAPANGGPPPPLDEATTDYLWYQWDLLDDEDKDWYCEGPGLLWVHNVELWTEKGITRPQLDDQLDVLCFRHEALTDWTR